MVLLILGSDGKKVSNFFLQSNKKLELMCIIKFCGKYFDLAKRKILKTQLCMAAS